MLLLITAGTRDEAERIGEGLVEEGLAGCGTVIPTVHSFYRWEGRMQREHEALLLVKTATSHIEAAEAYVKTHHTYHVPEILRIEVSGGYGPYLDWLLGELKAPAAPD